MPMPFHPARPGHPRDLTPGEWRALKQVWRHQRLPLAPIGLLFLMAAAYTLSILLPGASRSPVLWVGIVLAPGGLSAIGLLALAIALVPEPERPGGRPRQVGRLAGRVAVGGKPTGFYVDGVPVVVASAFGFLPQGEEVDLEVLPALEAEPNRRRARQVISMDAGRRWIGDPGMTKGWFTAS